MAGRDDIEAFEGFVARHGLEHVPQIADVDGAVWDRFDVHAQPSWVFIDGETGAAETLFGALGADGLTEHIEGLRG